MLRAHSRTKSTAAAGRATTDVPVRDANHAPQGSALNAAKEGMGGLTDLRRSALQAAETRLFVESAAGSDGNGDASLSSECRDEPDMGGASQPTGGSDGRVTSGHLAVRPARPGRVPSALYAPVTYLTSAPSPGSRIGPRSSGAEGTSTDERSKGDLRRPDRPLS
ncbi:uncharacterized protein LOC119114906 [Pollicipes pollicipes]|uniref:uncharacterized protein LOC119114906 n=1 Tax=Pollicipes pollicipes TaxID=41117 RepID=UPI0018858E8B|nr:uncharacterized protein LOC119114906 [Pollicipes pollicipes]